MCRWRPVRRAQLCQWHDYLGRCQRKRRKAPIKQGECTWFSFRSHLVESEVKRLYWCGWQNLPFIHRWGTAQPKQSNLPTVPHKGVWTPTETPFQSLAKRGCCCWQPAVAALACNESPSPEGTGWHHPLMVCQPSAYPCENKTFITHMRTGYEQMTQKSGGFQVLLPSAWAILLSHETCCDIFCVGCRVENNPKPALSFSPKIMYNSFNIQIKENKYHKRGKCGSKGKTSCCILGPNLNSSIYLNELYFLICLTMLIVTMH